MLIAGLKLTHDGTLAIASDDRLLFSVELEKMHNWRRYSHFEDFSVINEILSKNNLCMEDIDYWVVDGWQLDPEDEKLPFQIEVGRETMQVHPYFNLPNGDDEEKCSEFYSDRFGFYTSFSHIYDHICSSYCTSQFAKQNKSSYIIVFDGGTKPLLFYFDSNLNEMIFCKELLKFGGDIYSGMASKTEAFAYSRKIVNGHQKFTQKYAGKIMAFIALGNFNEEIYLCFLNAYEKMTDDNCISNSWKQNRKFEKLVYSVLKNNYDEKDILTTFHFFLQNMLCDSIKDYFKHLDLQNNKPNLCLCGGNFLNIKWNSAIRELGIFDEIFAPPFINDTGIAIGAICAKRMQMKCNPYLHWNTYSGPELEHNKDCSNWSEKECSLNELAKLLADTKQPVLMLNGRCELGPRALGNRSIIADARCENMKDLLNDIKCRETYRPIAPICIEEDAPLYFIPGTPDKYMLFEHLMTKFGEKEVPAVKHLDGTARLQTIAKEDNPVLYELLVHYKKITGISVLCNTSGNYSGKGFFPDVESAQKWGRIKHIWSEGKLYYYD